MRGAGLIDRACWGMQFLLCQRGNPHWFSSNAFRSLLSTLDPETSISIPVPIRLFHRGADYSHPRHLYSNIQMPRTLIHILLESLFTSPGIGYSHDPEYAPLCGQPKRSTRISPNVWLNRFFLSSVVQTDALETVVNRRVLTQTALSPSGRIKSPN